MAIHVLEIISFNVFNFGKLNTEFIIFIVAPCILVFIQFIHQQMHIY